MSVPLQKIHHPYKEPRITCRSQDLTLQFRTHESHTEVLGADSQLWLLTLASCSCRL